ncbi:MAG: hypothetical protein HQK87_09830 [Nitrospinae bacterium]|nr:hypothetical protein [Nitrospinota bacterium]
MFEHSYYWIGYGIFFIITGVTMIGAMYARRKNEGIPFNYRLLAINWGTCYAMWAGTAITEYLYNTSETTTAFMLLSLALPMIAGIAWMSRGMVRNAVALLSLKVA